DGERELVERAEAIERDRDVLEVEDDAVGEVEVAEFLGVRDIACEGDRLGLAPDLLVLRRRPPRPRAMVRIGQLPVDHGRRLGELHFVRHCFQRPTTPFGMNSVTRMKIAPSTKSQYSGIATVKTLFAPFTSPAPRMGPTSVPRPPTAAQMAIS